jgi:heme/copper-type cytochrome/quinol oxidase subunit 3
MSDIAQPSLGYEIVEGEPPVLMGRNLNSAAHLLASATAFFFLAFIFAYFYLRSLNNAHLWRPKHVDPSVTLGTLVMALTVASALLVRLGLLDHRAGRRPQWRLKGVAALAVGLIAVVLQFVEWTSANFGPADGGYASVFIGWTAFDVLFILGTLLWLENLLATAYRYRKIPSGAPAPGEASGDPGRSGHDISDPLSLVRSGLESLSYYWAFLAGMGVLAWIILYLV